MNVRDELLYFLLEMRAKLTNEDRQSYFALKLICSLIFEMRFQSNE